MNDLKFRQVYVKYITETYRKKLDDERLDFRDVMQYMYVVEDRTIRSIAREFDVSPTTISKYVKELGLTKLKIKC